jgi:hypothetical protein
MRLLAAECSGTLRVLPPFAANLQVRHAAPFLSEILDLQYAELFTAKRDRGGRVANIARSRLGLSASPAGASRSFRAWWSPRVTGVLPSYVSGTGRFTPLTG